MSHRDKIFFVFIPCFFASILLCVFNFSLAYSEDFDGIIVQTKRPIVSEKRLNRFMYRYGVPSFQKIKNNLYVLPLNESENIDIDKKIFELKKSGQFSLVEPDYKFSLDEVETKRNYTTINKHTSSAELSSDNSAEVTPNDKDFPSQYYLKEINATKAWNTTVGDSLLVGILDTGVDINHPDLAGKVEGLDSASTSDKIGHGTEVAGIIAADTNNSEGIAGVAWNTKVLSIKVTDDNGQAKVSSVVSALDKVYDKGVKIVQISLSTNQFSQALKNGIDEAVKRGILIISTGGNTGVEELRYPAGFNGVVGVGAVDENKEIESYSTTGDHISLVAPGSNVYTTTINSTYKEVNGTSFAAPQVAGTAALIWSVNPALTNNEVKEILLESAFDLGENGKDKQYGYGLLNTQKAVELAKEKD